MTVTDLSLMFIKQLQMSSYINEFLKSTMLAIITREKQQVISEFSKQCVAPH